MEAPVVIGDRDKTDWLCCYGFDDQEKRLSRFNYVYYDENGNEYDPSLDIEEVIERALLHDAEDEFVALINISCDSEDDVPSWTLEQMFRLDSVKCFAAVFNGETEKKLNFYTHKELCGFSRPPLLHLAALYGSSDITKWLLNNGYGDEVNRRCEMSMEMDFFDMKDMLPFDLALGPYLLLVDNCWTREASIFRIILSLCGETMRPNLEIIRLLAQRVDDIQEQFFDHVEKGRLVLVAALLLVAHEKVLPIKISKEKHGLAIDDGELDFRCFLAKQLAIIDMLRDKFPNEDAGYLFLMNRKHDKCTMKFMLSLFHVFDRIGDHLRAIIQLDPHMSESEFASHVARIFNQNGLFVKDADIDDGLTSTTGCSWHLEKIVNARKEEGRALRLGHKEKLIDWECKTNISKVQLLPLPFSKQQAAISIPVRSKGRAIFAQPKTSNVVPNGWTKICDLFSTTLKRGVRYL